MKKHDQVELLPVIERLREKARKKIPESDVDDLVQDVLAVLVERLRRGKVEALQAYAEGILRHMIYDFYRKRREYLHATDITYQEIESREPSPEDKVVWMRHLRVIEGVAKENEVDDALIQEHFVGGAPLREVASNLGVSPGVVNGRLFRFRQKLMQRVGNGFAILMALSVGLWSRVTQALVSARVTVRAYGAMSWLVGMVSVGSWMMWSQEQAKESAKAIAAASNTSMQQDVGFQRAYHQALRKEAIRTVISRGAEEEDLWVPVRKETGLPRRDVSAEWVFPPRRVHTNTDVGVHIQAASALQNTPAAAGTALLGQLAVHALWQNRARARHGFVGSFAGRSQTRVASLSRVTTAPSTAVSGPSTSSSNRSAPSGAQPAQQNPRGTNKPKPRTSQSGSNGQGGSNSQGSGNSQATSPHRASGSIDHSKLNGQNPLAAAGQDVAQGMYRPSMSSLNMEAMKGGNLAKVMIPAQDRSVIDMRSQLPALRTSSFGKTTSFCMQQDARVYRCGGGKMNDITGPPGPGTSCEGSALCSNVLGAGPSLLFRRDGSIWMVGESMFRVSQDQGQTWTQVQTVPSAQTIMNQAWLVLNQAGGLWRQEKGKWSLLRKANPALHEVRIQVSATSFHFEDDGMLFKGLQVKIPSRTGKAVTPQDLRPINPQEMAASQRFEAKGLDSQVSKSGAGNSLSGELERSLLEKNVPSSDPRFHRDGMLP